VTTSTFSRREKHRRIHSEPTATSDLTGALRDGVDLFVHSLELVRCCTFSDQLNSTNETTIRTNVLIVSTSNIGQIMGIDMQLAVRVLRVSCDHLSHGQVCRASVESTADHEHEPGDDDDDNDNDDDAKTDVDNAKCTRHTATNIFQCVSCSMSEQLLFLCVDTGCFSASTMIGLADGSSRSFDSLTVGDEVQVYSSSGDIRSDRVLSIFRHFRSTVHFLEISTNKNNEPLRLTPSHSILIAKGKARSSSSSSFNFDLASSLEIGDYLLSSNLTRERVSNIKEILVDNQTISTALTFDGNLVVNGLIASSYASYSHRWMHLLTMPLRVSSRWKTWSRLDHIIVHVIDFYSALVAF
jgi:hypothetical protein